MSIRVLAMSGLAAAALLVLAILAFWAQATSVGALGNPSQVNVTLGGTGGQVFSLAANPSSVVVGQVQFNATNQGTISHEVVVLKTDLAETALPVVGQKVNEDAPGIENMGEIEDAELGPNQSANTILDLPAGKYVLICNLVDHYSAGMHQAFTVGAVGTPTATPSATSTASPTPTTAPTPTPAPTATASATPVITPAAIPKAGGPATGSDGLPWAALIVGIGAIVALTGLASVTMIQRQRWR